MKEVEIFDTAPPLIAEIVAVCRRHILTGKMSETDIKYAAEAAVYDLLCVYRDKFPDAD